MKHTDIKTVLLDAGKVGEDVAVCGWVRTFRDSAQVAFLELSDGTSFSRLQVVIDKSSLTLDPECTKLGASVAVKGKVVKAYKGEGNELNAQEILLLGKCPAEYPIQKKRTTLDFLRGIPHLRLRTNTFQAVFLPPTLVASIFGMNYRYIPFLETTWGFWLSLILMVISAVLPLVIFRIKRYI